MIDGGELLALIPARAGSERLPGKNTALIAGKPLITWSVKAALESKYVDRVIVSTEDDNTATLARLAGAEVPFKRPDRLATSSASTMTVIKHALDTLEFAGYSVEYLLLLQPTSPLRNSTHIDDAIACFLSNQADSVIGVTEVDHPMEWTGEVPENLSMDSFLDLDLNLRSQEFPKRYRINGAIYIANVSKLIEKNSFLLDTGTFAYIMDGVASIDIDTKLDFMLAETLLEKQLATEY